MEINLNSEIFNYIEPSFNKQFTKEETFELNIPDSLPDIISVVSTECIPLIRSKDAEAGSVTVTGTGEITVLYYTDVSPEIQRMTANIKISSTTEDSNITADSLVTAKMMTSFSETRMLNSRKVLIKTEIYYDIVCYSPQKAFSFTQQNIDNSIQISKKNKIFSVPIAVNEKTFSITDSIRFQQAGREIGDILSYRVNYMVDDVKQVGNKAVVKGIALTDYLYRFSDNRLGSSLIESPFSQIVEFESEDEVSDYNVLLMTTGVYLNKDYLDDFGGDTISLEINAVIQCVAYRNMDITYVDDAYGIQFALDMAYNSFKIKNRTVKECYLENFEFRIELPDASVIIDTSVACTEKCIISENNIKFPISAKVLYEDGNGEYKSVWIKNEMMLERSSDIDVNKLEFHFLKISSDLHGGEVYIKIPCKLTEYNISNEQIDSINVISYDEENQFDSGNKPSVTAYRVKEGDSLWQIAKKYNAIKEIILNANMIEDEKMLRAGEVLLIPYSQR